jgi:hypothetical protein
MPEGFTPESASIATRAIVLTVIVIIGLLIAVAFGLKHIYPERLGIAHVAVPAFPAPGVRPDEGAERQALETQQRARLSGADGHMSIDDAMRAIAAKGPHAFDPPGASP